MSVIKKLHHAIPPGFRKSYQFLIVLFRKMGQWVLPANHYRCRIESTGEVFNLAHVGRDRRLLAYWLDRICDSHERIGRRGMILRRGLSRYLNRNEEVADIALVEVLKKAKPQSLPGSFLLPRWMEMELDVETSLKRSRMKEIRRNIQKHSLVCETRTGKEAFDLFYYKMYLPLIHLRHATSGFIADYKHFSGKYMKEDSQLFFILQEGKPVAGIYVETKNERYRLSSVGILDADMRLFKMDVIGAFYYFVMTYYHERGINTILVGSSMAVASDGVTEFKNLVGAKPHLDDLPGREKYLLRPLFSNPAVGHLLKSNPLIHMDEGGLHLAIFAEDRDFGDKQACISYFKRLRTGQYAKTVVFYRQSSSKIRAWCTEEGMDHIEFSLLSGKYCNPKTQ